ncbi:hypothetical protein M8J75_006586 [Diaphorina citri]|nr:hypothetical protein M8J75_006586 [Diaphorina citri]
MKNTKDLSLSGSQINLQERPSPRTSTPRIRRPTSAVPAPGYDGPTRSKPCYERPQSADESLGTGRNSEFPSRCSLNKSLFSQRFDSDFDLVSPPLTPTDQLKPLSPSPPLTPSLKPGLATKPPPGPSHTASTPPLERSSFGQTHGATTSFQAPLEGPSLGALTPLEPSLEEDIIDLKFRNWFPNSLKYPNELPAFTPDSRISTNDIPSSCRSTNLIKRRHVSDNYLNKIGTGETERNVGKLERTESEHMKNGGQIGFAECENMKSGRQMGLDESEHLKSGSQMRLDELERHPTSRQSEHAERKRYASKQGEYRDRTLSENLVNHGEKTNGLRSHAESDDENHVTNGQGNVGRDTKYGKHGLSYNYSDHADMQSLEEESVEIDHKKKHHSRSAQQIMRYNSLCKYSSNNARNGNVEGGFKDMNGYQRGQQMDTTYIGQKQFPDNTLNLNNLNRYDRQYNEYNQHGDTSTADKNGNQSNKNGNPDVDMDSSIGATSKEYFIEYTNGKTYEDNQQEHRQRYEENDRLNETYENEISEEQYKLANEQYKHSERQEYWKQYGTYGQKNEVYVRKSKSDRDLDEQCTQNNGGHNNSHGTNTTPLYDYKGQITPQEYAVYQYYAERQNDDENIRCDSCARNQFGNPKSQHKSDKEYVENCYHSRDRKDYQYDKQRHYEAVQNESDSAMSEDNHYNSSMNILDRIYTGKRKGKSKHPNEKQSIEELERVNIENKNGKRKSLENLNSHFAKSLSEDTSTHGNDRKTKPMDNENTTKGANVNENRITHYLDMYDFEQDEKILNHILQKSKLEQNQTQIPEIKVNNESLMTLEEYPVKDMNSSTYKEIVDILKVLENEEKGLKDNKESSTQLQQPNKSFAQNQGIHSTETSIQNNHNSIPSTSTKLNDIAQPQDNSVHNEVSTETIQVGDIYSFLDKVDNQVIGDISKQAGGTSKLSELMKLSSADLAQKYLTLSINMDEKQIIITALEKRIEQIDKHCKEMKTETDATVKRLQKFIAQLIKEKKDLGEQCSEMCKSIEKKYKQIIETMEERHKIEIKKNTEKHLAAEKIRREKWIDNKTQKIKELTVKGLEPELLKMTNAHQEEIAELRKAHNRQIEENDAIWNRKMNTMKEKFEEDLQNAILQEKENNRKRLDEEMKTVENNYQEQRKHLLNEIRIERENLDRQAEDMRNEKEKELNQKLEKMSKQNKETCERLENKHQDEIKKLKEELNQEKQLWIETKTAQMEEKEQLIREQCKRERDKHIELIIQKLEKEQTDRNNAADTKIKNMKEQHDKDIDEMESTLANVKSKLNDTRTKLQDTEDQLTELKSQVHSYQIENKNQTELLQKLNAENKDLKLKSEHQTNDKINRLEEEIEQTRSYFETLITRMKKDQERELSQVYGRVKETIGKKDQAISLLTQQKQAALTQCASLEAILAQRKH